MFNIDSLFNHNRSFIIVFIALPLFLIFFMSACSNSTGSQEESNGSDDEYSYEVVEIKPTFTDSYTDSEIRKFIGDDIDVILADNNNISVEWVDPNESDFYEFTFLDPEGNIVEIDVSWRGYNYEGIAYPDSVAVFRLEDGFEELAKEDHFFLTIKGYLDSDSSLIAESKQIKVGFLRNETELVYKENNQSYEQFRKFFEEEFNSPNTIVRNGIDASGIHTYRIIHYELSDEDPGFDLKVILPREPSLDYYSWDTEGDFENGQIFAFSDIRFEEDDAYCCNMTGTTQIVGDHSFFVTDTTQIRILEFEVVASGTDYGGDDNYGVEGYVRMIIRQKEYCERRINCNDYQY